MGGFIGSGSCGQVYKAMEVDTGRIIAVKKIPYVNAMATDMMSGIDVNYKFNNVKADLIDWLV